MELVSVVVPVYKVEQYLERCVKSICEQTYQELEIILVNDGSPDRCGEMCEELAQKDNRIQVLHKQNGGLSDARNAGVKLATGKYLLFVDSDDYIAKDLVEKAVAEAEKMACDMVLFDYYCVENGIEESSDNTDSWRKSDFFREGTQIIACTTGSLGKIVQQRILRESRLSIPKRIIF